MCKFIELPSENGERVLVNTNYIEEIRENKCSGTCTIYMAFYVPNAIDQDHYKINMSYDKVVSMIYDMGG